MGRGGTGVALAVAAVLLLPATALGEPRRVPDGFFGINGQHLARYDDAELQRAAQEMAALGIERVRKDFSWSVIEREGPTPDWGDTDRWVGALAREGVTVAPIAIFTPGWARDPVCVLLTPNGPTNSNDSRCPPQDLADFAAFARKIVERYGRGGDFWDEHQDVPPRPIESVEIWNEENAPFWAPSPNPQLYGQMYQQARAAMRQVDPAIMTIVGGLATAYDGMMDPYEFLTQMGTAGVDAIAIHSYGTTAAAIAQHVVTLRSWMDSHGLQERPLLLNEWGWITSEFQGGAGTGGLPEAARAELFREVASRLARSDCGLFQVTPHTWETLYDDAGDPEHWFGVARIDDGPTELSPTAVGYGDQILKLRGSRPGAPRAAVHLCGRPAPDRDGDGVEDQHDYAPTDRTVVQAPLPSAPASYELPVVSGTMETGESVDATTGTWDGSPLPTFSVERWEHCDAGGADCQTIAGATGWELVPDASLGGRTVRVVVRATNDQGTSTAASQLTPRLGLAPTPVAPPTVIGQPRNNNTLYSTRADWDAYPDPVLTFQWFACDGNGCRAINGATKSFYTPNVFDVGKRLYLAETARNTWGTATQASASTAPVTF